jgi:uncharacterized protein
MGKVLLLVLLALIAYLAIRAMLRSREAHRGGDAPAEDMVACEHCGVNLPRSEALERRGRYFCSEEHRALGAR